jgi:hypothetical protein
MKGCGLLSHSNNSFERTGQKAARRSIQLLDCTKQRNQSPWENKAESQRSIRFGLTHESGSIYLTHTYR